MQSWLCGVIVALIYEAVGRSFRIQCRDLNWHYSRESTYPALVPQIARRWWWWWWLCSLSSVHVAITRLSCTRNDDHQRTRVMLSSQQQQQQEGALEWRRLVIAFRDYHFRQQVLYLPACLRVGGLEGLSARVVAVVVVGIRSCLLGAL